MLSMKKVKPFLTMKNVCIVLVVLLLVVVVIIPYAKVGILTLRHADEFMQIPDGLGSIPTEVKVYEYKSGESAECLVLVDDGMCCDKINYEWSTEQNGWVLATWDCVWTKYGGNAHHFYWPMFYWKDFFLQGW